MARRGSGLVGGPTRIAVPGSLAAFVILSYFTSRGWQSWDVEHRPVIPERMPILIDEDLLLEDGRPRRARLARSTSIDGSATFRILASSMPH